MSNHSSFSTVIAVDRRTLGQLEVSLPTWRKNQPAIFAGAIVCMYDRSLNGGDLRRLWRVIGDCEGGVRRVSWPPAGVSDDAYESQRERMLSAFMAGAAEYVETPVWLKIDTDVLALSPATPIFDPAWFTYRSCETWGGVVNQQQEMSGEPVIVAPRWGYTKNKDGRPWLTILDAWGNEQPSLAKQLPLNIPEREGQVRVSHRRHCSWVAFYRTDWTRRAVAMLEPAWWKLPVPSQDTFAHYVAARAGDPWLAVNMKARGLNTYPGERKLRQMAAAVMNDSLAGVEAQP